MREYPDHPTNRPDPIIEDGHKAPDQRKSNRSYIPFALAAAAFIVVAAVAAVAVAPANESQEQFEQREQDKYAITAHE